jgi:hypothetical protein
MEGRPSWHRWPEGNEPLECDTMADRFQLVSQLIDTDAMRERNIGRCFG